MKLKIIIRKLRMILIIYFRRTKIKQKNFSIISNNCWGGFVSKYFNLPYNSPFVGLFIFAPDYLKLLQNINYYMSVNLSFIEPFDSRYKQELIKYKTLGSYPIGLLDDVEIHFLHYKNNEEAINKWERRKKRINYNYLIVKFCERDLATNDLIKKFDELDYNRKICLTANKYEFNSCLKLINEDGDYVENEWVINRLIIIWTFGGISGIVPLCEQRMRGN